MKRYSALLLFVVVFIAGCNGGTTSKFYADPIQIDEGSYVISPSDPFSGGISTIQFSLVNLGRETVRNIEIYFFDPATFKLLSFECGTNSQTENNKCTISELANSIRTPVKVVLQAPDLGSINPTQIAISYSIRYPYTSSRVVTIPIVDDVTITKPQNPYTPSSQSDGPITLEIEPPKGGERIEGKNKIIDKWIRKNIPFEMKFSFKQVGSSSFGTPTSVLIKAGNLQIKLQGLKVAEVAGVKLPCDLQDQGDTLVSKTDFIVTSRESTKFSCNLVSSEEFEGFQNSVVEASFSYDYEIIRKETLTVKPRLQ